MLQSHHMLDAYAFKPDSTELLWVLLKVLFFCTKETNISLINEKATFASICYLYQCIASFVNYTETGANDKNTSKWLENSLWSVWCDWNTAKRTFNIPLFWCVVSVKMQVFFFIHLHNNVISLHFWFVFFFLGKRRRKPYCIDIWITCFSFDIGLTISIEFLYTLHEFHSIFIRLKCTPIQILEKKKKYFFLYMYT